MSEHQTFRDLAAVIADPLFPRLDQTLRSGHHVDDHEPAVFHYLIEAQPWLEPHYLRYGADLVLAPDGFFYLRPIGDRLPTRLLKPADMLVGQALALFSLEPLTLEVGFVTTQQLLERLRDLFGERLPQALKPKLSAKSARHRAEKEARSAVRGALITLQGLGFVALDDTRIRLRSGLMRFVDPARGSEDLAATLEELMQIGELEVEAIDPAESVESVEPAEEEEN